MDINLLKKNIANFKVLASSMPSSPVISDFYKTLNEFEKNISKAEEIYSSMKSLKSEIAKNGDALTKIMNNFSKVNDLSDKL